MAWNCGGQPKIAPSTCLAQPTPSMSLSLRASSLHTSSPRDSLQSLFTTSPPHIYLRRLSAIEFHGNIKSDLSISSTARRSIEMAPKKRASADAPPSETAKRSRRDADHKHDAITKDTFKDSNITGGKDNTCGATDPENENENDAITRDTLTDGKDSTACCDIDPKNDAIAKDNFKDSNVGDSTTQNHPDVTPALGPDTAFQNQPDVRPSSNSGTGDTTKRSCRATDHKNDATTTTSSNRDTSTDSNACGSATGNTTRSDVTASLHSSNGDTTVSQVLAGIAPSPKLVWATKRQSLCDSLPQFKSHEGGIYTKDCRPLGILLSSNLEIGDMLSADKVIYTLLVSNQYNPLPRLILTLYGSGGGREQSANGLTWTRNKDYKPTDNQIAGWKAARDHQSPILVIIGKF